MINVLELERKGNVYYLYNADGTITIFNDETHVVIEKDKYGHVVHHTADDLYIMVIKTIIKICLKIMVKTPGNAGIWVNPLVPLKEGVENWIDLQGGIA